MSRPSIVPGILAALCVLTTVGTGARAPRAAETQKLIFSSNHEDSHQIYVVDPTSGAIHKLHETQEQETLASWSPDGKKIAFCSSRSGNHEIWVMDADGSNPVQLTNDPAPDFISCWSPDGKKIAFTTLRKGDEEIFVMNADGSEPTNLTHHPEFDGDPAWSPDGKKILFTSKRDGAGFRMYVTDPEGKEVRMLPAKQTAGGPVFAAWSPDGKKIAYGDEDGQAIEIFTCDADGSNPKKLTALGGLNVFPAWAPDGKRIAVLHWDSRESAQGSLWTVSVPEGAQNQLCIAGSFMKGRPAWKPE